MLLFLLWIILIQGKTEFRNVPIDTKIAQVQEGKAAKILFNIYAMYQMDVYYESQILKSNDQGEVTIHKSYYEAEIVQEFNVDFKIIQIIMTGSADYYLLSETCKIYYFNKNNREIEELFQLEKDCISMKYQQQQDCLYIKYQDNFARYCPWRQSYTNIYYQFEKMNDYFVDNFGYFYILKDNGFDQIQYAGDFKLQNFLSELQILQVEIFNSRILIVLTNKDIRSYLINQQQLSLLNSTSVQTIKNPISFITYQGEVVLIHTTDGLYQTYIDYKTNQLAQLSIFISSSKVSNYNLNDINAFYLLDGNFVFSQHSIQNYDESKKIPTKMNKIAGSKRDQDQEFVVIYNESTIQVVKIQYNSGHLIVSPSKSLNLLVEVYSKVCSKVEVYNPLTNQCRFEIPLEIQFIPDISTWIYLSIITVVLIMIVLFILIRRQIIRKRMLYHQLQSNKKPIYII